MGTQYGKKYDSDVVAYIKAVESADGALLETSVRALYYDFIVGCKNDGIWNSIKASCLLGGARTLNGALVPLVGNAPTNVNFISSDYNRKTGLVTDGTKYLNLGYDNNDTTNFPTDNSHASVYIKENSVSFGSSGPYIILGAKGYSYEGGMGFQFASGGYIVHNRTFGGLTYGYSTIISFVGTSKSTSAGSFIGRTNRANTTSSTTSTATPSSGLYGVFGLGNGSLLYPSGLRISFYSLGRSLDLAKLDARISKFMADLALLNL
jgi:hypothetical protein